VSRSRVASKAMQWVICMETSHSVGRLRPTLEKWLLADREHWVAYMAAREQWARWQDMAATLPDDHRVVSEVWGYIERRKAVTRAHRQFLWMTLGVSLLVLMLV
jgi:ferric-dicitrate binding protein FerR (iron transport regulator)